MVWKYTNKKDKLWKRLETKYGFPVPEVYTYEKEEPTKVEEEEEEETVELDEEEEKEESGEGSEL